MKIDFWKPTSNVGIIKATVHQSGKLGFSQAAIDKLNLGRDTRIKIGKNAEDRNDECIYLAIVNMEDENTIRANKAGQYYYLNARDFFNEIGLDYKKKKVIYDIIEVEGSEGKLLKLIPREKERKKKK